MRKPALFGLAITAILLIALIVMVLETGNRATADREIPGMGIPGYVFTGADDTLYGITDRAIYAIGSDGNLAYRYDTPDGWCIACRWQYYSSYNYFSDRHYYQISSSNNPIVASDNGTLYIYLVPEVTPGSYGPGEYAGGGFYGDGRLVSIDRDGRMQWSLTMKSYMILPDYYPYNSTFSDVSIDAHSGKVYMFHGYNETIVDASGTVLCNIADVSDPAAVDEDGNIYLTEATTSPGDMTVPMVNNYGRSSGMADYRVPSVILDSYYPNGTLRWRTYNVEPPERQQPYSLPLYHDGTLYVFSEKTVRAYYTNGSLSWITRFNKANYPFTAEDSGYLSYMTNVSFDPTGSNFKVYTPMPFDTEGNLYVQHPFENAMSSGRISYLIVLGRDGSEISSRKISSSMYYATGSSLAYGTEKSMNLSGTWYNDKPYTGALDDLETETLIAYDLRTGQQRWSYKFPTDMQTSSVINATNVRCYFTHQADTWDRFNAGNMTQYDGDVISLSSQVAGQVITLDIHPGNDRVYVNFQTFNYESPVIYGQSKCIYSGGLYAIGNNGTLLWRIPLTPGDRLIAVGNSTVLYGSGDGKVYVKYLGAMAGIALLSILAVFSKFFLAGTISRARSRLDKNENRTSVLRYIAENPGSTMYEIARDTGINTGTVRYHLLILGVNHKIVEYHTDGKYVRFFTNANSYSPEERMIISLMRRDAMGRVLKLLAHKPGASNAEISSQLDIPESVTSRCTKELSEKGLVVRVPSGNGFLLDEKFRDSIMRMMSRI